MKKVIMLFLLCGGALAQTIAGKTGTVNSTDQQNTTWNSQVYTLPQIQSTPGGTPTPQTSAWISAQGAEGLQVEFAGNTFNGFVNVQVSNNPTPVSTPGVNYYTVVRDNYDYATQGGATFNWSYFIKNGWKWFRFNSTPSTNNTGTLNLQYRLLRGDGNNVSPDGGSRTLTEGVPFQSAHQTLAWTAQGATTVYNDYKLPAEAHGFYVYTNVTAVSGASTITTAPEIKDPVSGALQALGSGVASHTTGLVTLMASSGIAGSAPSGATFFTMPCAQDVVLQNILTGTGTSTLTQTVVPIR